MATEHSLILVYTGNGKGKTSATFGQMARALGHGARCAVIQFIKNNPTSTGEWKTFHETLGVPWYNFGSGFTWQQDTLEQTKKECQLGWEKAKRLISSEDIDLLVLDEFTYTLSMNLLNETEIIGWLDDHRYKKGFPHLVISGRHATNALVELADMVSEIQEVKHHLAQSGKKAAKMVEF